MSAESFRCPYQESKLKSTESLIARAKSEIIDEKLPLGFNFYVSCVRGCER